jgi:hypothetical protein
MSKRPEDNVPDYRAIMVQSIFDMALTQIAKQYPQRTPAQQQRWARYIAEEYAPYEGLRSEKGWSPPNAADVTAQLDATAHLQLPDVDCHRPVPDRMAVEQALAKAQGLTAPADRVTLHREVARMSDDELLKKIEGLELAAEAKEDKTNPTHTPSRKPTEKAAHLMCGEELAEYVGQKLGRDHRHMLPSEIKKYADAFAEQSKPKGTPALDELRSKLAQGRAWMDIPFIERVNAERESKDVLGKSLQQMGLTPT